MSSTKWADYVITGVWFSTFPHKHIAFVRLHEDLTNDLKYPGLKVSKTEAIGLLKKGKTIVTAKWNYSSATWTMGAKVDYFKHLDNIEYLRTDPDTDKTNNLDNSIDLNRS